MTSSSPEKIVQSWNPSLVAGGIILGVLAGFVFEALGLVEAIFGFDVASWASGLPGAVGGLVGGGAAGAGPKVKSVGSSAGGGDPPGDSKPPPILRNDPDNIPGLEKTDEKSYLGFVSLQDFLGKVLPEGYDGAQKRFKDVSSGKDFLGTDKKDDK